MRFRRTLVSFIGLTVMLLSGELWLIGELAAQKSRIVFTSKRDSNLEIYVMDADGGNHERLTNNPANDRDPDWSPDGQQIAFASDRGDGRYQIYVMDADGSNPKKLTDTLDNKYPSWSPNGQKIAFTRQAGGRGHIAVMDADGHNALKLTDGQVPSWSADGQKVAFEFLKDGINQIYVININGQEFKRVTHDLANKTGPAWSPNGQQIAYAALHEHISQIYVVDADGKNRVRLTHNRVHHWAPAWSPDGQTIAYWISNVDILGGATIHLMTADGKYLKQLSDVHDGGDFQPDISPLGLAVSPISNKSTTWGKLKKVELKRR